MDGARALKLIKDIGAFGLGGTDGCLCTSFEIQGVNVDVACRKSSGSSGLGDFYGNTIRVYTYHLDEDREALRNIAIEVERQIKNDSDLSTLIRYCDYEHDHKNKCVYCGNARSKNMAYYCDECIAKKCNNLDEPGKMDDGERG